MFGELVLEAVAHVGGADGGEVRTRVPVEVLSAGRGEQTCSVAVVHLVEREADVPGLKPRPQSRRCPVWRTSSSCDERVAVRLSAETRVGGGRHPRGWSDLNPMAEDRRPCERAGWEVAE